MIVVDVQRAGPSTGMPTKTEQADLLLAMFGRHGESPMPIVARPRPRSASTVALEAARIAVRYRHAGDRVVGHVHCELIRAVADPRRRDPAEDRSGLRDSRTAATSCRTRATTDSHGRGRSPGPPASFIASGTRAQDGTGNISYEPANHELMTRLRQAKVDGIADDIPALEVDDPTGDAQLLVLGWGSSLGTITAAVIRARAEVGRSRRPISDT